MRLAQICSTPIAGAAWAAAEAFREAGYDCFSATRTSYNDGRVMPSHYPWPPDEETKAKIAQCDLIFCPQGRAYTEEWYPKDKPTIVLYYSQPTEANHKAEEDGCLTAVVGQYVTRLYPPMPIFPNLYPLKHPWYQPGPKPDDRIRIVYSPSNNYRKGWDDKGYTETAQILRQIVEESDGPGDGPLVEVEIIEKMPLEASLKAKATAHIVIDECVTGSYHRSSLDGIALGCVVINNCDSVCDQNIRRLTGGCGHPFTVCDLAGLQSTLQRLIDMHPGKLAQKGEANRQWMEGAWNPEELIRRNLLPLMDEALARNAKHG